MNKQRWSGLLIGLALSVLLLGACMATATPMPAPATVTAEGKVWQFPDEGVEVMVPTQATPVRVVTLDLPSREALPTPAPGEFEPNRLVINFDVVYSDTGKSVQEFDPPIQISVHYTTADFEFAAKADKLPSLAFWDGTTLRRYSAEKHKFNLVPDGKELSGGGVGVVLVSNWGDPTQIWGR